MKIGIVATHSWPIPTPVHTGDIVILDLAIALQQQGHEVTMFAPEGTRAPGRLCPINASLGTSQPSAANAESDCWHDHRDVILAQDVIHDFSILKGTAERMFAEGRTNFVCTPLGGQWDHPNHGLNMCCWSQEMRGRGLRGETDYVGSPTPDLAGPPSRPILDAHVVYGGVDTEFYNPGVRWDDTRDPGTVTWVHPSDPRPMPMVSGIYRKSEHFLWMGRWHPVRGFKLAIDVARETGCQLKMVGENPSYMKWQAEKDWAAEAVELARDLPNVTFEYLPPDPHHHINKREQYRRAKALLLTTQFQEPFGLTQVEAMACGTPVIATNLGSHPEVAAKGGMVVENTIEAFAKAVSLFRDGASVVHPDRARDVAVHQFSRQRMAMSYVEQYMKVIAGETWGGRA